MATANKVSLEGGKVGFEGLASAVKMEMQTNLQKSMQALQTNEVYLRNMATSTRWTQFQTGKITRDALVQYTQARVQKQAQTDCEKKLARLKEIFSSEDIREIEVSVRWVNHRDWGKNPQVTVTAKGASGRTYTGTGSATGAGYDKLSGAAAKAFNSMPTVLKILCVLKEQVIQHTGNAAVSSHNAIGYGSGYHAIPEFEGGVGMSTLCALLCKAGFKCDENYDQNQRATVGYTFIR